MKNVFLFHLKSSFCYGDIVKSGNDSTLFLKQEIFTELSFLRSQTKAH